MPNTATPAATDPLALPVDLMWFEELLDASIAYQIARAEYATCVTAPGKLGKRYALAKVFRRAAHLAELETWGQYCFARAQLPVSHFQPQQAAA